jgi:hypothetical protein
MGNRKKYLDSEKITENDYKASVKNYEQIREKIKNKLNTLDNLELFAQIILFKTLFNPRNFDDYKELNKPEIALDLDDIINSPNYLYGVGLSLSNTENGKTEPSLEDYSDFLNLLNDFYEEYGKSLLYYQVCSKDVDEGLISSSKQHYLINQENKERYSFQTKELLFEVFGGFNDFFTEILGFDINDAMEFSQKIIDNFKNNIFERLKDTQKIEKDTDNFENKLQECLFKKSKILIEIDAIPFCNQYKISNIDKFQKYLERFSCSFGEGNQDYNLPIDDNIFLKKPLIKYQSKYYLPDPGLLNDNLPEIFDGFLDQVKTINPKIWNRYLKKRKQFTEKKVSSCFSRIFPEKDVHNNLFYNFKDPSPDETDHIIPFHDNILIVEDKSGKYTTPARRGGIKRIRHHIKELVEDSYVQGLRCRDYIKSSKNASFKNDKQKIVLTLNYSPKNTDFILINVTLEHLYNLSSVLILKTQNTFKDDEYLWSLSLFDLDLITQYFPMPIFFIHYIESRLRAPNFFAFDETSFLGYYLQQGNFTVYPIDGKIQFVTINPEYITKFDQHYLKGDEKPKLEIEEEIFKLIQDLERLTPENFTRISNTILDLRHDLRKQLIEGIKRAASKTSIDGQRHDTLLHLKTIKIGISVFTQIGTANLHTSLKDFCNYCKNNYDANCWIGIGIDILDRTHFAHEFVFIDNH